MLDMWTFARPFGRRLACLFVAAALSVIPTAPASALIADLPVFGPPLNTVLIDTHHFGNTALMPGAVQAGNVANVQFAATGQPCAYREQNFVGSAFSCSFLNVPDIHFVRYQQQIHNPNAFPVVLPVGFYFPGGGSPIFGTVGLGAGSSFVIGINVDDNAIVADSGFQFLWNVNASPWTLRVSAALIEDASFEVAPGSFDFIFFSDPQNDFFVLDPNVTPLFRLNDPQDFAFAVAEPGALLGFGLALVGLARFRQRQPRG